MATNVVPPTLAGTSREVDRLRGDHLRLYIFSASTARAHGVLAQVVLVSYFLICSRGFGILRLIFLGQLDLANI